MGERINMRCGCGNAKRAKRHPCDPPDAVEMFVSCCPLCDEGDFEEVIYTTPAGRAALNGENNG